jgi:hypothetical protein
MMGAMRRWKTTTVTILRMMADDDVDCFDDDGDRKQLPHSLHDDVESTNSHDYQNSCIHHDQR